MSKIRVQALALALAIGIVTGVARAEDPTEFIRYQAGQQPTDGALQVAKATYVSDATGVKVILYGVVHIADAEYYRAVQADLDRYDAVLYEAVKPPKDQPKPAEGEDQGLSSLQKGLGEMLGLSFQMDAINYQAKNLIHADMTYDQLLEASGGDLSKAMPGLLSPEAMKMLGPMLKMGLSFMKQMMAGNPAMRDNLKRQLGQQMVGQMDAMMTGEMHRVIIVERNKVAMKVLEEQLAARKEGSLAIFYGAGHNKDLHERLVKLGFRQQDKTWMSAWRVGNGVGNEATSAPVKPTPEPTQPPVEPHPTPRLDPNKRYY